MEFLKRNSFWFFCALVVVGVVAFWLNWIRSAATENSELSQKLEVKLTRLKGIADKKNEIRTERFIKSAKTYKKKLRDEGGELREIFVSRQLKIEIGPGVPEPPLDDRTRFREWLTMRQDERCAAAAAAGMRCNRADPVEHGDIPEREIAGEDIPMRLRQYLISREIHGILANIRATISCLKPSKTGEDEEVKGTQERGIQELRRIEWMGEGEMAVRRTGAAQSGPGVSLPPDKFPKPYNSFLFELAFVAHFSLVPKTVQALEASSKFFFVVRRADISRISESSSGYGPIARRVGRESRRREEYKNQRYLEAPVRVVLECEVLEFGFPKDPDPLAPKEAKR